MALHDYGMHCERCGARLTLRESSNGGLCTACLERAALEDDEKRPPECGNVRRFNESPASGMVADDLGRWVRFEDHNAECLRLESMVNALSMMLAQHQGRSFLYWQEFVRRELEKT